MVPAQAAGKASNASAMALLPGDHGQALMDQVAQTTGEIKKQNKLPKLSPSQQLLGGNFGTII